jgi:hypothetical protein
MRNCKEMQELFSQYLDEALDKEKSQMVKEHIASCAKCRYELEELNKMSKLLSGLSQKQPPSYFLKMLHGRIESRKSLDKFLKDLFKSSNFKVPVTLAVVALFAFALLQIIGQTKRGVQGRLSMSGDGIGEQYSPGTKTRQKQMHSETGADEPWVNTMDESSITWSSHEASGGAAAIVTETTGRKQSQSVISKIKPLDIEKFPAGAQKQQTLTVDITNIRIVNTDEPYLSVVRKETESLLSPLKKKIGELFKAWGLKKANLTLNIQDGQVMSVLVKTYQGKTFDREALENILKKISFPNTLTGAIDLQLSFL